MSEPIWLSVMRGFEGLQEVPGSKSNPVILNWVKMLDAPKWYDDDDKPWCAIGLNAVLRCAQMPTVKTADPYDVFRAKGFEGYGNPLQIPALGCIMVFSREGGGHVGLYLGERKDAYSILGMNQSNTVGIGWLKKERLTATRWPIGGAAPVVGRVWLNGNEHTSVNEA